MDRMLVAMYLVPIILIVIKAGIMFSVWGLVMALTNLVRAATELLNAKTFNEVDE